MPQSSAVRRKSVRQCDTAQPGRVPESAPKQETSDIRRGFSCFGALASSYDFLQIDAIISRKFEFLLL